eukprot:COSAG05_NODE_829_length_7100_cov_62.147408_7_plen_43_part_00
MHDYKFFFVNHLLARSHIPSYKGLHKQVLLKNESGDSDTMYH